MENGGGLASLKSQHFPPKSYINPANESLAAALTFVFFFVLILEIRIMLLLGFYEEKFILVSDSKTNKKNKTQS